MPRRILDAHNLVNPTRLAEQVADYFTTWKNGRQKKEEAWAEVRNYVFATDTTTTTNASLPWKNKTTRPKLCQIRDNLHANYMAALFPNDHWFVWKGGNEESATKSKAKTIETYMRAKLRDSKFEETISRLVYDFIDYGNVVADVEWANDRYVAIAPSGAEEEIVEYVGPKAVRYSPFDVVFDPKAASFERSPKIVRHLLSFGEIEHLRKNNPEWREFDQGEIDRMRENRKTVVQARSEDIRKDQGLIADGFNTLTEYYSSGNVEILEFEGDIYDVDNNELKVSRKIIVADRAYVLYDKPLYTWTGRSTKQHCGWRLRPDNLYGMGPLDNLVGLQYRIDHLENLKADVFDQIAHPMWKVKGYVEPFKHAPDERIYMDIDADVEALKPDTTALNADMQIQLLEAAMELYAGAPREAMGIRSPGEKTAFEVDVLTNAASRMFQQKIAYFERHIIDPLLNGMLEMARRNLDAADVVSATDDDFAIVEFLTITRDDLKAKGRLQPMGARHFAAQNQLVQNLTQLSATGLYQDPAVAVHFSGLEIAKMLRDNLSLTRYSKLVQPNIRVMEQMQTQKLAASAQEDVLVDSMTPLEGDSEGTEETAEAAPPGR